MSVNEIILMKLVVLFDTLFSLPLIHTHPHISIFLSNIHSSSVIRITLPLSEFVSHYHYMKWTLPSSLPPSPVSIDTKRTNIARKLCDSFSVVSLLNDAITKMYRIGAIKLCTRPSTMLYAAFILVYVARISFGGKSYTSFSLVYRFNRVLEFLETTTTICPKLPV